MAVSIKKLIDTKDYEGLRQALSTNSTLANAGIPYDGVNTSKAHPLHRVCDGVFSNKYSDEEAVEMATIFLDYGANINGGELVEKHDTPLIAAASLSADKVGLLYIEQGAEINHPGCHGGTALHWAAWCGRPVIVRKLVKMGAPINKRCIDFKSTPLFWAIHGYESGGGKRLQDYLECVKILLDAGANKSIPNKEGMTVFDLLTDLDNELKILLNTQHF